MRGSLMSFMRVLPIPATLTVLSTLMWLTGCGGGSGTGTASEDQLDHGGVWSPASLYASLAPGESKRFNVQFTASGNAVRLDVDVPSELSSHVAVSPRSLSGVRAGQRYQLEVTLSSSTPMAVGVKDGSVQLLGGAAVWSSPLPVDLTFSPIALPPDPGAEGMATLEGVDADGDGIRDDVQRWIVLNHPDSQVTREALKQRVLNFQEALLSADDPAQSIAIAQSAGRAIECLFYVRPDEAAYLHTMVKTEVLNTFERTIAFISHNEHVSGQTLQQKDFFDWQSSCAFEPAGMEN